MVQPLSQNRFFQDRVFQDRVFASLSARDARVAVLATEAEKPILRPMFHALALGALVTIAVSVMAPAPANAMTMQECSAKYKAAQAAGTLGSVKWNDFRKAQCGDGAATAPAAAPATGTSATGAPATRQGSVPAVPAQRAAPAPSAAGNPAGVAAFPSAISPKYQAEKPAKQRMHTCLDQYNANKVSNANGGLKWIQKGGGYYSECNKRLKG